MANALADRLLHRYKSDKAIMHSYYSTLLLGLPVLAALAIWVAAVFRRVLRDARPGCPNSADAILVFGAFVWPNGPSPALRVRVERAAQLYREGFAPIIVCSGGWSSGASEAAVMRTLSINLGVPANVIIPDDGGTSTRKAIRGMRCLAQVRGWHRIICVSSPYHMHRIGLEARRQRLDVILCPAPRSEERTLSLRLFYAHQQLREIKATLAHSLRVFFDSALAGFPSLLGRRFDDVLARIKWLLNDADAVAQASDAIGERIKHGITGFSDSETAVTPEATDLLWPLAGKVTSPFGLRYRRLHAGVDIRASYGSDVCAAAMGRVLISDWISSYGNVAVVHHGGGLSTLYAHLTGLIVGQGEVVTAGQVLGFVGDTGRSFGPHLHLEVRVHGAPVDPMAYLPAQECSYKPDTMRNPESMFPRVSP